MTAGYFNLSLSELISQKRQRAFAYPRQMAMYLCRKYTKASLKEIGEAFGNKDHSTVLYAVRQIEKKQVLQQDLREDIVNILNLLE